MIDKASVRRLSTHPGRGHFLHLETGGLKKRPYRGLSQEYLDNFIKWYLSFADEKKRKGR
jgi:hypothetical protein